MKFKEAFIISFGAIFIYMIIGVFFKHQLGVWMAGVWYVGMLVVAIGAIYFYMKRKPPVKETKVVNAEIVK